MRKKILSFSIMALSLYSFSQNDLLNELDDLNPPTSHYPAFKAMKIGNLQSTKIASQGDLYMYVSHRFGTIQDGMSTFFGLDKANTKIQLIYGLLNNIQIGISRESLRQTYAGSAKITLKKQNKKFPFNVSIYSTINLNGELNKEVYPLMEFYDRLSYATQILISKRITSKLSLELAPTFVRQNLVLELGQKHNQIGLGIGGRYKLSKRNSLNLDYVYNFNRNDSSIYRNPLTIGIDIETGGHVFQLLFSNAQSTNEPGFISNSEGNWKKGDVFFGFNIVRVF